MSIFSEKIDMSSPRRLTTMPKTVWRFRNQVSFSYLTSYLPKDGLWFSGRQGSVLGTAKPGPRDGMDMTTALTVI